MLREMVPVPFRGASRKQKTSTSFLPSTVFLSWTASLLLLLSIPSVVAAKSAKSAADYYVRSLPGAPEGPLLKMHAG